MPGTVALSSAGMWRRSVRCEDCDCTVLVTAAGRSDDPVSFWMPCNKGTIKAGDSQGMCETTSTERFYNPLCACKTYPTNLGPCASFEMGGNGRCVYCDHEAQCHKELLAFQQKGIAHVQLDSKMVQRTSEEN